MRFWDEMNDTERLEWTAALTTATPAFLVGIDMDGVVRVASRAYADLFQQEQEEIVGHRLLDFRPDSQLTGTLLDGMTRSLHRRLSGVDTLVNFSPVIQGGAIVGAVSIGWPISELEREIASLKSYIDQLERSNRHMSELNRPKYTFESFLTETPTVRKMLSLAKRCAKHDLPVLLVGESGTGKELLAQSIHNLSPRHLKPFIAINCSAIPGNLLESEFFGYEAGAFTGAKREGKPGLIAMADQGTLFMDEVAELPIELQSKLLRVLQEQKYRKVGGTKEYSANFRLIAATNQDIPQMIKRRRFREDLFYRINVVSLHIPPLRERLQDIPLMVAAFVNAAQSRTPGAAPVTVPLEIIKLLMQYQWPGNVRELKNAVEYAVCMAECGNISLTDFPEAVRSTLELQGAHKKEGTLQERLDAFERSLLSQSLDQTGWTLEGKKRAAESLNISLGALYYKLKKLGLSQNPS